MNLGEGGVWVSDKIIWSHSHESLFLSILDIPENHNLNKFIPLTWRGKLTACMLVNHPHIVRWCLCGRSLILLGKLCHGVFYYSKVSTTTERSKISLRKYVKQLKRNSNTVTIFFFFFLISIVRLSILTIYERKYRFRK